MDAPVHDLGALATIALLFVAVGQVMALARNRRELEERLGRADAEIHALRRRLDEATRPPMQFARMRMRERAMYRFGRLRRAVPRRRMADVAEGVRDLTR